MNECIEIKPRKVNPAVRDALLARSIDPLLCDIVAKRVKEAPECIDSVIEPKLSMLDSPFLMQDMSKSVIRLIEAIKGGEVIGIETDHDCDGQTAHAVIYTALTENFGHPSSKIQSYIGHRLTEGYGLSEPVVTRILNDSPQPTLVITADNGSSDEAQIATLHAQGIDVIVTDHHALPLEGPPKSAFACLNPTRANCDYPDPYIAGCMVAWLFMAATNNRLIADNNHHKGAASMASLLDFVAVGTVADCVSLARSVNNRAVIRYGLHLLATNKRPCWQAILSGLSKSILNAEDLGFKVGPLLNSDGRLANAFGSVSFLLANNKQEAMAWVKTLTEQNTKRKAIQKAITETAMQKAVIEVNKGRQSLVIYIEEGHAGVHGISASRIKDSFGRPTIIFSPKTGEPSVITGSARSIDSLHMRDALQWVEETNPGLLLRFGGHHGAAGLTLKKINFKRFSSLFEQAVTAQIGPVSLCPVIMTDGLLQSEHLTLKTVDMIQSLDPYGREFEKPVFEAEVTLVNFRLLGDQQQHVKLTLALDTGESVNGIWFNAKETLLHEFDYKLKDRLHIAFTIEDNKYRNNRTLQLLICYARVINPGGK